MDKQHWPGPVWVSRLFPENQRSIVNFTYPDWENAGLGIVTEPVSQAGACHNTKFSFTRSKDVDAEFPLSKTVPFAYPLLEPRQYSNLETGSEERVFAGNRLDTMVLGDQSFVCHPVQKGTEPQRLTFSQLIPGSYNDTKETENDRFFHKLKKVASIPIEKGIQQLVCQEVCNNGYILSRSEREVQLIGVVGGDEGLKTITCHPMLNSMTTDASLSDVFPGMCCVVCADGQVYLFDSAGQRPLWDAHLSKSKFIKSPKYHCDFGDHPQCLLAGNESTVWLCDTRTPVSHASYTNPAVQSVFSVDDIKSRLPNCEKICSFKQVYGQSYMYVVTRDSIYVVDLRNDSMPVLQWHHMMNTRPNTRPCFINTHRINNTDFVMVASENDHKMCVVANEWISDNCSARCQGISLPKHFMIECDTANFGHGQNLWFSHQVVERLSAKWTGIATFTHQTSDTNMSFLSLYANGDIFSQDLHFLGDDGDSSNIRRENRLKAFEQGQDILHHWEEQIVAARMKDPNEQGLTYYSAISFFEKSFESSEALSVDSMTAGNPDFTLNGRGMVKNKSKRTVVKKAKQKNMWNIKHNIDYYRRKKYIDTQRKNKRNINLPDYRIWLFNLVDQYISELYIPRIPGVDDVPEDAATDLLPRKIAKLLRLNNLKNCKDPLASKILPVWLEDKNKVQDEASNCDSQHSPGFAFRSAPFNIKTLASLPLKFQQDTDPQNDTGDIPSGCDTELNDSQYCIPDLDLTDLFRSQESAPASQASQTPSEKTKVKSKKKKKRFDGF